MTWKLEPTTVSMLGVVTSPKPCRERGQGRVGGEGVGGVGGGASWCEFHAHSFNGMFMVFKRVATLEGFSGLGFTDNACTYSTIDLGDDDDSTRRSVARR